MLAGTSAIDDIARVASWLSLLRFPPERGPQQWVALLHLFFSPAVAPNTELKAKWRLAYYHGVIKAKGPWVIAVSIVHHIDLAANRDALAVIILPFRYAQLSTQALIVLVKVKPKLEMILEFVIDFVVHDQDGLAKVNAGLSNDANFEARVS